MVLMVSAQQFPEVGYDYSWSQPSVDALKAAGAVFVCRYLSYDPGKNLTPAEARALDAAGIAIVCNWETTANRAEAGYQGGVTDAQEALAQAQACGMPAGRPIYFSVDEPTSPGAGDYFRGVASVLGVERTGGYGGYPVIKALFDANLITYGWQTYGWSGGMWDERAQLRQVQNGLKVGGADVDLNHGMTADFGQWSLTEELDMAAVDDIKAHIDNSLKFWMTNLMGERTQPAGNPSKGPTTLAALADGQYLSYYGDATHPVSAKSTQAALSGLTGVMQDVQGHLSHLSSGGTPDPTLGDKIDALIAKLDGLKWTLQASS